MDGSNDGQEPAEQASEASVKSEELQQVVMAPMASEEE